MGTFLGIIILFGLITFTAYGIIGIVKGVRERKSAKKSEINTKGVDSDNGRNGAC